MNKKIVLVLMYALAACVFSSRAAVAPYDAEKLFVCNVFIVYF